VRLPGILLSALRWLEAESDKDYRYRGRVGPAEVLSNDPQLYQSVVALAHQASVGNLQRIEVSDVPFLRRAFIDVAECSVVIPERVLQSTEGGPRKLVCLLLYADLCIAEFRVAGNAASRPFSSLWDEAISAQAIEIGGGFAAEAKLWALEAVDIVRSRHPLRRS
jgi:hypothetical protein